MLAKTDLEEIQGVLQEKNKSLEKDIARTKSNVDLVS